MVNHLHSLGYSKSENSLAVIYTCAHQVMEFSGNITDLEDLQENIHEIIDFSLFKKDVIILKCVGWDVDDFSSCSEWEIVEEFDFQADQQTEDFQAFMQEATRENQK